MIIFIIAPLVSFGLAYSLTSLYESIKRNDARGVLLSITIFVIISGSFIEISPLNAKYWDFRSDNFDIPSKARVIHTLGFIPIVNPNRLRWSDDGKGYEYKRESGSESLSVAVSGNKSFSDAKLAMLNYVENKKIHDEIINTPITDKKKF